MKEPFWRTTDEKALRRLWKDYGSDLSFKDFKKWIEAEMNAYLKRIKNEIQ